MKLIFILIFTEEQIVHRMRMLSGGLYPIEVDLLHFGTRLLQILREEIGGSKNGRCKLWYKLHFKMWLAVSDEWHPKNFETSRFPKIYAQMAGSRNKEGRNRRFSFLSVLQLFCYLARRAEKFRLYESGVSKNILSVCNVQLFYFNFVNF